MIGRIPLRVRRAMPYLLVLAIALGYSASLSGGYLNWDDPWLIRDNPVLQDASADALRKIWFDFSVETRMALGAEYLPLRLGFRPFGRKPRLQTSGCRLQEVQSRGRLRWRQKMATWRA
ncbi:MAG: hypothetical protein L6Q84_07875 [Polyangiaceae bacterium]|nr:hypothetical protein [Polyangiaceae bacterium]